MHGVQNKPAEVHKGSHKYGDLHGMGLHYRSVRRALKTPYTYCVGMHGQPFLRNKMSTLLQGSVYEDPCGLSRKFWVRVDCVQKESHTKRSKELSCGKGVKYWPAIITQAHLCGSNLRCLTATLHSLRISTSTRRDA